MNGTDEDTKTAGKSDPSGREAAKAQSPATSPSAKPSMTLPADTMDYIRGRMFAADFGNIVTILMQSARHKDLRLNDLLDHAVPPLMNKQFRVAEVRTKTAAGIPAGLILWANVADDVHERLSKAESSPLRLKQKEWTGGDHTWIIEAIGDERFLKPLIKDLRQKEWKDKTVHFMQVSEKGLSKRTLPDEQAANSSSEKATASP